MRERERERERARRLYRVFGEMRDTALTVIS